MEKIIGGKEQAFSLLPQIQMIPQQMLNMPAKLQFQAENLGQQMAANEQRKVNMHYST